MSTLVEQLLLLLRTHPLVAEVKLLNYDETPQGKLELKIRCKVNGKLRLQIWLHYESAFQDYAYQLFTHQPLLRWDNAPHYPNITTFPHHFHAADGTVHPSSLTGDVTADLQHVLQEIEVWVAQSL